MNRKSTPLTLAIAAVVITAGVITAGCGSGPTTGSNGSTASSAAATTSSSAVTTESGAPAPTGTLPSEGQPSANALLTPTDVRAGDHDGYDRVVIELGGKGTPGWIAEWTTDPMSPGSGEPIDVSGESVLRVRITGVGYPGDTGSEFYSGPNPVDGTGIVTEVHLAGVFEGESEIFIGVDADQPSVRISVLSEPARLVIDIAD